MSADFVRDYLALPERSALSQFIVKDESDQDALAASYVFTPNVKRRLDVFLGDVGRLFARGQDFQSLGRWVFGSFGSGKSHFLRVVGMMLSGDQRLYAMNHDPALTELQGRHAWLAERKILVVRVSMMGRTAMASLTATLARAFDARLVEEGKPPAEILGYDRIFTKFDAYVARAPEQLVAAFETETAYDRATFDRLRAGSFDQRRQLARECARFMDDEDTRFEADPEDARDHMARHAKALGYDGVAFLIDEFVLWAQSLPGREYMAAVNELTGLVDAERRPLPFLVLAAIQRNINEAFPDDDSEKNLRESLGHTQARFSPPITLEDRDLFEIARRRVLAVKPGRETEWAQKVAAITRDLDRVQSVLVGSEPPETLAQLYPFTPALMHVLGNVSQGLQRERTSLFMLYQLLIEIRPDLVIGQLVSLGALWEALYSADNVELLREQARRRAIRDASRDLIETYDAWVRLTPDIRTAAAENEDDRRVLDLVVKSVLLCQLSKTRFFGDDRPLAQETTIENLVRLNRTEIPMRIERSAVQQVERVCDALARLAPSSVRIDGRGADAKVHVDLEAVDLGKLLASLRPQPGERFATLRQYVAETLDIGREIGEELSGTLSATWRQTARRGKIRLDRIEQLAAHGEANPFAAEANEAFRVLVLLDVADQTVAIDRVASARDYAQQWSAVVVPATLSGEATEALEILTKLERTYPRDKSTALGSYRLNEQANVERQIASTRATAERRFRDALALAYGRDAQLLTLRRSAPDLFTGSERDPSALVRQIAGQLLDLRYPQHPRLQEAPRPAALATLVQIVARASRDGGRTALANEDENARALRLGVPLEILDPGANVASLRASGQFVSAARDAVTSGETTIVGLRRSLAERFGLTNDVADTIIAVLAIRDDYRIAVGGTTRAVSTLADVDAKGVVIKGTLPTQAVWVEGRAAAIEVFALHDIPPALTPANVETLLQRMREARIPALKDLASARDAVMALRRDGWFDGDSAPLNAYAASAATLAALPDDQGALSALVALSVAERASMSPSIAAAATDAQTLRDLGSQAMYRKVESGLGNELRNVLRGGSLPLAPQLIVWEKKAGEWIERRISEATPPGPPERPERPAPPAPRPESQPHTVSIEPEAPLAPALMQIETAVRVAREADPRAIVEVHVVVVPRVGSA